jgi:hypothetical protein
MIKFSSLLIISLCFLSACSPTYKDETIGESIKERIREEYNISNVQVERNKNTIWVYIPLERLVDDGFDLSKAAMEKIGNVSLVCSRLIFSSDAKVDFISIIAYDNMGIELNMHRFVEDIKKVQAWYIGYSDFYDRMDIDLGFNPRILGENTVRSIYSEINKKGHANEIGGYFFSKIDDDVVRKFPGELGDIVNLSSIRVNEDRALIYLNTKNPETEQLFLVDVEFFDILKQLLILYLSKEDELLEDKKDVEGLKLPVISGYWNLNKQDWPEEYIFYRDTSSWKNDVYSTEINFKNFISQQILRKIKSRFNKLKVDWEEYYDDLEAAFLRDEILITRELKSPEKPVFSIDPDYEIKLVISRAIKNYELEEVNSIIIGSSDWDERISIDRNELLALKPKKWKRLQKIKGVSVVDVIVSMFVPGYGNQLDKKNKETQKKQ